MPESNSTMQQASLNGSVENSSTESKPSNESAPEMSKKKTRSKSKNSKKGRTTGKKIAAPRATKQAYNFPKCPLEDCVKLVQTIEEKNAGKPAHAADLTKMVGFNQSNDWRFQDLLRSAAMFGLTEGTGETATVSLTKLAEDIVSPKDADQRREAIAKAFHNVQVFHEVADYYKDGKLPESEYFGNTLTRDFDIPRERVGTFIDVFTTSLAYVSQFSTSKSRLATVRRPLTEAFVESKQMIIEEEEEDGDSGPREFLDTCFVLMPFGGWYDTYYQEVYIPAIKSAGMEAFRADDLFHSGSVMEQIWSEIKKAKVLLAEVTGKNANVFYELGLSHAIAKPVVLVTGCLEDVPFDLRHLRVVEYDVRDPDWAGKVRKSLTSHLKNAMADPSKSLPSPFKDLLMAISSGANVNMESEDDAAAFINTRGSKSLPGASTNVRQTNG